MLSQNLPTSSEDEKRDELVELVLERASLEDEILQAEENSSSNTSSDSSEAQTD